VRETLRGQLTRARRAQLHRAVATAIEADATTARDDLAALLAHHYLAAEEPGRALPYLKTAAMQAARRVGLSEAIGFLEQASEAMDAIRMPPGPDRYSVLASLGQMNLAISNLETAAAYLDQAAALHDPETGWRPSADQRSQALRIASLALITSGDLLGADQRLQASFEGLSPESRELPSNYYHMAQLRWHEGRHADAYAMAERCLTEAEKHGDPQVIARGYEMLALACHSLGQWKEGAAFVDKRQALVGGQVDVAQTFDVHL
jgi:tetratricopeptide (TPR) repeat protein